MFSMPWSKHVHWNRFLGMSLESEARENRNQNRLFPFIHSLSFVLIFLCSPNSNLRSSWICSCSHQNPKIPLQSSRGQLGLFGNIWNNIVQKLNMKNLVTNIIDLLRAFRVSNVNKFWIPFLFENLRWIEWRDINVSNVIPLENYCLLHSTFNASLTHCPHYYLVYPPVLKTMIGLGLAGSLVLRSADLVSRRYREVEYRE